MVLGRPTRPFRTNTPKRCPFHYTDAHTADKTFKSTSTDNTGRTGTSPRKVTYMQSFDRWAPMLATDTNSWSESFIPSATGVSSLGYDLYKTYPSMTTPNNWYAGQGMFIYSNYRDEQNESTGRPGVALQMEGQGRGYVQFVDSANSPRGVEQVKFTARVGQFIDFDDFSYYDAPVKMGMTNYTLCARVAYDTNKNKDFSGNASLSLIAYYRPKVGCYEFRIEQRKATRNNTTKAVTGVNRKSELLSFYKWVYDQATGKMNKTLLGSWEYTGTEIPETSGMTGNYWPVYFSVSNDVSGAGSTWLVAGVMRSANGIGATPGYDTYDDTNYDCIGYRDTKGDRLKSGTYGVVSANCPGVFMTPFVAPKTIGFLGDTLKSDAIMSWTNKKLDFGSTRTTCLDDIFKTNWVLTPGRMESYYSTTTNAQTSVVSPTDDRKWGIKARTPAAQPLGVYLAPAGTDRWQLLATTNVATFGTSTKSGDTFTFKTYTTRDSSVKIAPMSTVQDVRVDIVIDDIEVRQFRGEDSYNLTTYPDPADSTRILRYIPEEEWDGLTGYHAYGKTNFLFTSAWTMTNGLVRLSARRTLPGHVSSIRSPLLDGTYDRGDGLGMISFSYRDAQENAKLLVQVATNTSASTIAAETPMWDTNYWTTVETIDFGTMDETARKEGVYSYYFGYHGVDGVARVVVDPATVAAVSNVTDTARFGEVWIDAILVRDEPSLDDRSWTGWNMRTIGDATDSEKFMYLPDFNAGGESAEPAVGLSVALNNSITVDVPESDLAEAKENKPFVQTPVFTANDVGSVTFRARRYDTDSAQPAAVVLLGSRTGAPDSPWTTIGEPFIVSNNTYATYSYTVDPGSSYKAFRLAVSGVTGVKSPGPVVPDAYDEPVRVLLDEIFVSEALRPRVGFRNVGAFRGYYKNSPATLNDLAVVPNLPTELEQPLCNESWGVQCEIYPAALPDEVDFDRPPRVRLYWYEGTYPWGFENWRTNRLCRSAWLSRASGADDDTYIFRSSYLSPEENVVMPSTKPGTVVQYMLEAVYFQVGSSIPCTNTLTQADWGRGPAWYNPLDLNRTRGNDEVFSAYNILDTVAPHWAWINEANIYGGAAGTMKNKDKNFQYVEIAVPAEADISGWKINLLAPHLATDVIITNNLATFGRNGVSGTKAGNHGQASNTVFRVIAAEATRDYGYVEQAGGQLDGIWSIEEPSVEVSDAGCINGFYPVGIQLVRASGIVEHEIVLVGTDVWSDSSETLQIQHSPSNNVNFLNALMNGKFFFAGYDDGGDPTSLGVYTARGETSNSWNNVMVRTPGLINEGQEIDPDHPTPNGSSIVVYCNLDTVRGHIRQTVGDLVCSNASTFVFIKKGGAGTNITYTVDRWYEIGSVTTNGAPAAAVATGVPYEYRVNVGAGASNNVTVVASAALNQKLRELGLGEDNRYAPAVVDWLEKGRTLRGPFANSDSDDIYLADYITMSGAVSPESLTLTQMYWLDMDPTIPYPGGRPDQSALALKGGMAAPPVPSEVLVPGYAGTSSVTNIKMGVYMAITNRVSGEAWTPDVLRGLEPGLTSQDYVENGSVGWTSVTFKVTALVANGKTSEGLEMDWIPVRWFVFGPNSFRPLDAAEDPGVSYIEVRDPHSPSSPAYWEGVKDWPDAPIFYRWAIDDRLKPVNVEMLKQDSFYTTTP